MRKDLTYNKSGILAAIGCTSFWGFMPIYWKALKNINSWIIVLYRIVLILVFAVMYARLNNSWYDIISPLKKDKKNTIKLLICGAINTLNWSVFIYAVNAGQIVQTSIGYYIEPLLVCFLGIIIFNEKLTKYNITAMLLCTISIVVITIHYHTVPKIALVLALTLSVYSAIKKTIEISPSISLIYETAMFTPFALIIIVFLEKNGSGAIAAASLPQYLLLLCIGIVSLIPMILFGYAAQRTSMFILGLTNYISPSIQLLLGLIVFGESLNFTIGASIVIIWIGLIIFAYGELKYLNDN